MKISRFRRFAVRAMVAAFLASNAALVSGPAFAQYEGGGGDTGAPGGQPQWGQPQWGQQPGAQWGPQPQPQWGQQPGGQWGQQWGPQPQPQWGQQPQSQWGQQRGAQPQPQWGQQPQFGQQPQSRSGQQPQWSQGPSGQVPPNVQLPPGVQLPPNAQLPPNLQRWIQGAPGQAGSPGMQQGPQPGTEGMTEQPGMQAMPMAPVLSAIEAAFQIPGPNGMPLPPIRQFGYSIFSPPASTFAPVDDVPVGPDYVVGPGDDLMINTWGPVDGSIVRTVDRNGRIMLPKAGDVRVWGLTFSQADRLIREQLSRYFRGFQLSVTMGRLRTIRVQVVGEVARPGSYELGGLSTLTNALFVAGGPTKVGSLREIKLLRNHHTVGTLDLYDFLLRGDRTRDFRLESNDTIFVRPIGDVAAVAGEVKRAAIYEVQGDVRVSDMLDMAGGLTPRSYLKRVQIIRSQQNAERIAVDVDVTPYYLKGDQASNPPVSAGDLILVYPSDPRIYNTVTVDGAVRYPGAYELKPFMRISQLLPPDGVFPVAYAERVEVTRRRPDLSLEVVPVNLKKAWAGDKEQDILLKPLDEVSVKTAFRPQRTIRLTGQVVRPGIYPIEEGERLSSVLARAGDFTEKAFLRGAVFTRAELKKTEQEQLNEFVRLQEQRILAVASETVVGADKEEFQSRQSSLEARREMLKALAAKVAVGRIVVHVAAPEALRGSKEDIVLVDGDSLDVPEPPSSVLVLGAVRTSTSVLYKEGANAEYYINRVGGFSKQADKKEVHIVKADGSALSGFTSVRTLEPGDTIVVPPKAEEKIRMLPTIRDVVQTAGSALLSFAALAVLF